VNCLGIEASGAHAFDQIEGNEGLLETSLEKALGTDFADFDGARSWLNLR
jgi:hypothetical protein